MLIKKNLVLPEKYFRRENCNVCTRTDWRLAIDPSTSYQNIENTSFNHAPAKTYTYTIYWIPNKTSQEGPCSTTICNTNYTFDAENVRIQRSQTSLRNALFICILGIAEKRKRTNVTTVHIFLWGASASQVNIEMRTKILACWKKAQSFYNDLVNV